jgi:ATP-dependent Clp protease protease subunit
MGMAASMATVLVAAGTTGKRFALPHSRLMIHQPTGRAGGQTADISIAAREILRWRAQLNEILSEHTQQPVEKIEKDSDRDYYMTAQEAKSYGIIDQVLTFKKDEKAQAGLAAAAPMEPKVRAKIDKDTLSRSFCRKVQANECPDERYAGPVCIPATLCARWQDDP